MTVLPALLLAHQPHLYTTLQILPVWASPRKRVLPSGVIAMPNVFAAGLEMDVTAADVKSMTFGAVPLS